MNLDEYIKRAAAGATVKIIRRGDFTIHTWQTTDGAATGWEYVIADRRNLLLGHAWTAGSARDRDDDIKAKLATIPSKAVA